MNSDDTAEEKALKALKAKEKTAIPIAKTNTNTANVKSSGSKAKSTSTIRKTEANLFNYFSMELTQTAQPVKHKRAFLKETISLTTWADIEPYFKDLAERNIASSAELEKWMRDRSELEAYVSEDLGWRYIKMTCSTDDKSLLDRYQYFVSEIEPQIAPYSNALNKKLIASPFLEQLNQDKYRIYIRAVKKSLEIFREENIPLFSQLQNEQQKYAAITGAMTIESKPKKLPCNKLLFCY